jgi:hypothetical protein
MRDFYLASFLRCGGYDLIDRRANGRHRVFVFCERPTRCNDALAFYARTCGPDTAFSATIKDMKALLHNA